MAKQIDISGKKPPKNVQMTKGKGWRLVHVTTKEKYVFFGELRHTIRHGNKLVAIFVVNR
jgi:hypothetical protein